MIKIILEDGKVKNLQEIMKDCPWYELECRQCGGQIYSIRCCEAAEYNGIIYKISEEHTLFNLPAEIQIRTADLVSPPHGDFHYLAYYELWTSYWAYNGKIYIRPQLTEFFNFNKCSPSL